MTQWRVFAEHIALDDVEHEKLLRNIAEYTMAFHNYEAVRAVQEARIEQEQNPTQAQDKQTREEDAFFKQLQSMGINLDEEKLSTARSEAKRQEREHQASAPRPPSARDLVRRDMDIVQVRKNQ